MLTSKVYSNIVEQLSGFYPISLAEMESVKLMDRAEIKFTMPVENLLDIFERVQNDYRVLTMKGLTIFDYETLYFDTPNMDLYHSHHSGRLNRCKLRYRNYVDTNTSFFEIKVKNNKGRTVKTRVTEPISQTEEIGPKGQSFLKSSTTLDPSDFKPCLWVYYSRLTLVSKHSAERITIDLDLKFKSGNRQKSYDHLAIIEVKQEKKKSVSPFLELMHQMRYKSGGLSKYCLGVVSIKDQVKTNRFKSKVNFLNKINTNIHVPIPSHRRPQFI
ncbi:VTC domain-containing protein [Dyadobacter jejuensis]|uniref:VTC domain-containing protein n=1 Tax=Dyadobacter jejuensis TaxID=1082580 RepID=A0A316AJV8_9BACT|nr:polyphosphate polymerase domain-containing protein [Dyadobacter jejuensis]PWJ57891.1 VTC domain-containing protein [Dyadobacter jejuensis]